MSFQYAIKNTVATQWPLARTKDHITLINGYPFPSDQFSTSIGLPLVRIRDINKCETKIRFAGEPVLEARIDTGDVLIGMDGDFNVAIWRGGEAMLNQRVCCLRPHDSLDGRYLAYSLPIPLKFINHLTHSTTVKHLSSFDVLNIRIPFPPLPLQRSIASFLDRETAKIDAMIGAKERLLALLAEKRRALITHAVTRGLNPDAPMRDSGIEWLGEIPEHWRVERLAAHFRERDLRSRPELPLLEVSLNHGVVRREFSTDKIEGTAADFNTYKVAFEGDVVFNKMRMWQGAAGVAPIDGLVSPDYVVAEPVGEISSGYAGILFRIPAFSAECGRRSHGLVWDRLRLYWEGFRDIRIGIPPVTEQNEIVGAISTRIRVMDEFGGTMRHSVALLRERRSSLITAAVTGQIDVEDAA